MVIPSINAAAASSQMSYFGSLAFESELSLEHEPSEIYKFMSDLCINGELTEDHLKYFSDNDISQSLLQSVVLNSEEKDAILEVGRLISSGMPEDLQPIMAAEAIVVFEFAIAIAVVAVAVLVVVAGQAER